RVEAGAGSSADETRRRIRVTYPEAGGAVVAATHRLGRSERAGLETLIGIDVGREEEGDVAREGQLAGQNMAEQLALAVVVGERRRAGLGVGERTVDVAAAAGK